MSDKDQGIDLSDLDAVFKFKIGDVVRSVAAEPLATTNRAWIDQVPIESRYVVTQRSIVEFSGGVQLMYWVRQHGNKGQMAPAEIPFVHEHELVACEPFKPDRFKSNAVKSED